MPTADGFAQNNNPVQEVLLRPGSVMVTKTMVIPGDDTFHALNETGLGFIPAGQTGDIATTSISVTNLGSANILYGGQQQITGNDAAAGVILPGQTRAWTLGKLSAVGIRSSAEVSISVEIIQHER